MALISGLLGVLDRCVCIEKKRSERLEEMGLLGCHDDGVGYSGRLGALLSACSWIIMLAALATNNWVETEDFGAPGCFCSNDIITNRSNGCMGRATIGLWQYCLYPVIPQYGNMTHAVCFDYDLLLGTPGADPGFAERTNCTVPWTATGLERFSQWNFEENRAVIMYGILASIVSSVLIMQLITVMVTTSYRVFDNMHH